MSDLKHADDDLKALGSFKEMVISILLDSPDVVSMTMPQLDDNRCSVADNFLGGHHIEAIDSTTGTTEYVDLLGHCFDVPYIPEAITDVRTLITMESSISRITSTHMKEVELNLFVFSHKDHIHMTPDEKNSYTARGFAGNRVDMLVSAIAEALKNHPGEFGIGKLSLKPTSPITPYYPYEPNNRFYGKKMSFVCSDFYMKHKNKR